MKNTILIAGLVAMLSLNAVACDQQSETPAPEMGCNDGCCDDVGCNYDGGLDADEDYESVVLKIMGGTSGLPQEQIMAQTDDVGLIPLTFCAFNGDVTIYSLSVNYNPSPYSYGSVNGADAKPFVDNARLEQGWWTNMLSGPAHFYNVGGFARAIMYDWFTVPANTCLTATLTVDVLSTADSPNVVGESYYMSLDGIESDAQIQEVESQAIRGFRIISTASDY